MNLILAASTAARNEIYQLGSFAGVFVSPNTSAPAYGECNDAVIGLFTLSSSGVMYNKYHASLLFANTDIVPDMRHVNGASGISGRDIISIMLKETPIYFSRPSGWYKKNYAHLINYKPDDIYVEIVNGRLTRGVLDSANMSAHSSGNMFHVIAQDYTKEKAIAVMHNMQQVAISHLLYQSISTSYRDLILPNETYEAMSKTAADIVNKSKLYTEQVSRGEIIAPIGASLESFFEAQQIEKLKIQDDFTDQVIGAIRPDNDLFRLIGSGTKGKIAHLTNMVSIIGQRLNNGERMLMKCSHKRALPYVRAFDLSPKSRGYIPSNYVDGMRDVIECFPAAQEARQQLISKALNTAVSGVLNRQSIMNLQSLVIDNYRMTSIHQTRIVQFAYGEDYIDPTALEKIKFPTIMLSDAKFKEIYEPQNDAGVAAKTLWDMMRADRNTYRTRYMHIELFNVQGRLIDDVRTMPVNIERLIGRVLSSPLYAAPKADAKALPAPVIEAACAQVLELCERLPYVMLNDIQWRAKAPIAPFVSSATWLMGVLVRSHLNARSIAARGLVGDTLKAICEQIIVIYRRALIAPGGREGIVASQAVSEPLTQSMLSSTHGSAAGKGSAMSGALAAEEILGARPLSNLKAPTMRISVLEAHERDKNKVQEIAGLIELVTLVQFATKWQIFFEKFGAPRHPQYTSEALDIEQFAKFSPLIKAPMNLVNWCIRIELSKSTLILKSMSIDYIAMRIRETFPEAHIVHTPDNRVDKCYLRVYMRTSMFKDAVALQDVSLIKDKLLETNIRGVKGIWGAKPAKIIRSKIEDDGSIKRDDGAWAIDVNGTSYAEVASLDYIDSSRIIMSSVSETARVLGIDAARQLLIIALRKLVDSCSYRHLLMYADEMTRTGVFTAIDAGGLKSRDGINILTRMGYRDPRKVLEEASTAGIKAPIDCHISSLMVGAAPAHGTLYNRIGVREDYVRENVVGLDAFMDAL